MKRIRYSLRSALLSTVMACVALAIYVQQRHFHERGLDSDYNIVAAGFCDVHEWPGEIQLGSFPTGFERVTKLQFNVDLHSIKSHYITHYNQLPYVETIVLCQESPFISDRVMEALKSFPRLRKVVVWGNSYGPGKDSLYSGDIYHDISDRLDASFEFTRKE